MMGNKLNILLLCNRPARNADASTVSDHLEAFGRFSRHRITVLSFLRELPSGLDLNRFDVVVIHYTIAIGYLSEHYISTAAKARVRAFKGLKVAFIQDEYRAVNIVIEALRYMDVGLLFTCVLEAEIGKVYDRARLPGLRAINNLTGYVPENLVARQVPKVADRSIDIGYRTRKPPFWLGALAVEKWRIADAVSERAAAAGLRTDISYFEGDRLYGDAWIDFVSNCRIMLGVESGASVFDFEGDLQQRVDSYVADHPAAGFEEVQEMFLRPYEGLIRLNQISPRCFEAAALRTPMVLFEGEYSGVLVAGRHYLALRKDYSNFAEIVAAVRDIDRLQAIADRAYEEIACNSAWSYRRFIETFDTEVLHEVAARGKTEAGPAYSRTGLLFALARSPSWLMHRAVSATVQRLLLGTPLRKVIFGIWGRVPMSGRLMVRPFLRLIGR